MSTPRTQALTKSFELLRAVAARPGMTASELARATGLPRSTATRTLRTLADAGIVEERDGWVPGYELVRLARTADPYRGLVERARPCVAALRDEAGESALLAVFSGRPALEIVLQLDPQRHLGVASWIGVDVPLHASAAGKLALAELSPEELDAWLDERSLQSFTPATLATAPALRAELATVRRRGWADLVDELEDGLTSLAAGVRDPTGALTAAIGISGPTSRLGRARRRELLGPLLQAAGELAAAFRPPP